MSKNLIPEIAKLLGVEIGEEFKVKGYDELTCMITDDKGLIAVDGMPGAGWAPANVLFVALLNGNKEIVKLPWKPKKGECYYTFELLGDKWVVRSSWWTGSPYGHALSDKGWIYRTREEAEAALPAVAKEIGVDYEL